MQLFSERLESWLLSVRYVMFIPVVFSLLAALGMIFVATVDTLTIVGQAFSYASPALDETARADLRLNVIGEIIGVIDSYLVAAALLIFALGLYELFISKIAAIAHVEIAPRLLLIRSLDDLKDRLAKVIVVILVVKFFQLALSTKINNPLELLYLALGILLVGGALYLTSKKGVYEAVEEDIKKG